MASARGGEINESTHSNLDRDCGWRSDRADCNQLERKLRKGQRDRRYQNSSTEG